MAAQSSQERYAGDQDAADPLRHLRNEFIIPSKADLLNNSTTQKDDGNQSPCIYLCGNSLGVQPKRTSAYINQYLSSWSRQGVYGHFRQLKDSFLPPWLDLDDAAKDASTPLFGALPSEVAIMETLTANLHLLMASFYRPTKEKYKIIIEGKAFPSDHYAALSQLEHHGFPQSALVCITPPDPLSPYLPTDHICSAISEHSDSTALVLLPGIQYYSGQLLDIATITAHAHSLGLPIGWDLAHAAGNVPLSLHDWDVDFAAWCSYKYLNSGPGAIGGLFVHEKHGIVNPKLSPSVLNTSASSPSLVMPAVPDEPPASLHTDSTADDSVAPQFSYRPRLSGWWGADKSTRFRMEPFFHPRPGAGGFQLSNPSGLDISSVLASLSIFDMTSMAALRKKSVLLTQFLQDLLVERPCLKRGGGENEFKIITPLNKEERGAQLSLKLGEGLLDAVMEGLEKRSVVVDERRPDVIRVAPAPLYNSFGDVWEFYVAFEEALGEATKDNA